MRIANIAGRPALVEGDGWIDINTASNGRFSPSMTEAYACWDELRSWADAYTISSPEPLDKADVQAPVPHPRQVFAIGLNFHDHAAETALAVPDSPMVFTKFPSCVTGPSGMIELPGPTVDWEVELIVIIGRETSHVTVGQSWGCVAGVTVGQDLSERTLQMRPPTPQFSLGKSFPGFGPIGPVVVTPDELADPDDVVLSASLNGEIVQKGKTSDLIFSVSELIAYL